ESRSRVEPGNKRRNRRQRQDAVLARQRRRHQLFADASFHGRRAVVDIGLGRETVPIPGVGVEAEEAKVNKAAGLNAANIQASLNTTTYTGGGHVYRQFYRTGSLCIIGRALAWVLVTQAETVPGSTGAPGPVRQSLIRLALTRQINLDVLRPKGRPT